MSYCRKKQLFLRFGKAVGKERWVQRRRLCAYFKAKETKISHTHTHTHTHARTHLRITSWGKYCCYPTLTMKKLKLKMVKLLTWGSEWVADPARHRQHLLSPSCKPGPIWPPHKANAQDDEKHSHQNLPLVIHMNIVIHTYAFIIYLHSL